MTREQRLAEATSLLKQAKQADRLAEKYRRDEEGYERNKDEASDLRRRAQDLLDSAAPSAPGKANLDDELRWLFLTFFPRHD